VCVCGRAKEAETRRIANVYRCMVIKLRGISGCYQLMFAISLPTVTSLTYSSLQVHHHYDQSSLTAKNPDHTSASATNQNLIGVGLHQHCRLKYAELGCRMTAEEAGLLHYTDYAIMLFDQESSYPFPLNVRLIPRHYVDKVTVTIDDDDSYNQTEEKLSCRAEVSICILL